MSSALFSSSYAFFCLPYVFYVLTFVTPVKKVLLQSLYMHQLLCSRGFSQEKTSSSHSTCSKHFTVLPKTWFMIPTLSCIYISATYISRYMNSSELKYKHSFRTTTSSEHSTGSSPTLRRRRVTPFQTWQTRSPTTTLSPTPTHTATPRCPQTETRRAHGSKTDQDVSDSDSLDWSSWLYYWSLSGGTLSNQVDLIIFRIRSHIFTI